MQWLCNGPSAAGLDHTSPQASTRRGAVVLQAAGSGGVPRRAAGVPRPGFRRRRRWCAAADRAERVGQIDAAAAVGGAAAAGGRDADVGRCGCIGRSAGACAARGLCRAPGRGEAGTDRRREPAVRGAAERRRRARCLGRGRAGGARAIFPRGCCRRDSGVGWRWPGWCCREAPLWLLDEPTLGLDAASVDRFGAMLDAHRAGGGMAVAATHLPLPVGEAAELVLG